MKTVTVGYGPINETTRSFPDEARVRDVINHPSIRAALGHGANVQALSIERRALNMDAYVTHGQTILLEAVANQKASDDGQIAITVNYGPINSTTKQFPEGSTVGDVLRNPSVKTALGFGDNVQAKIDNVPQNSSTLLSDGDTLELEAVANQKAC